MSYSLWLINSTGEHKNRLQKLLPVFVKFLSVFIHHYDGPYLMKTRLKLIELSGGGKPVFYLKVHLVLKAFGVLTGAAFASIVAFLTKFDTVVAAFGCTVCILASYLPDFQLDRELRRRRMQLKLDFPFFLMKLSLLLNTGMSLSHAWGRIASDGHTAGHLHLEVRRTAADIAAGKAESKAYEDFAKRCRIDEITRLVSILEQYRRKGSFEIVALLKHLAGECWERRKNMIAKLAEESATRMLLPLMLIFIGIMIIVIAPAVISLRNVN